MLLVKTFLKESSIAGMGLFAAHPIAKGTVIWRFQPELDLSITQQQYLALSAVEQDFLDVYTYLSQGEYILCGDHARFMNHDNAPNTTEVDLDCIATRDIEVGEELTCNYFNFDEKAAQKLGRAQ